MTNRLRDETSPYLLQHQDNPVDWYPWGSDAIARAVAEKKPIFLSIGYSACHWCHVMERESFENQEIAGILNEHFVSIKVDREERPDLDQIYMAAVQLMTGRGGWPMSVFLTEDLEPFFCGTYWPPEPRMGMPGFDQVLNAVAESWKQRRSQIGDQAAKLTAHLREQSQLESVVQPLDTSLLSGAEATLESAFDATYGGFGGAPKFPHPMDLKLLLRLWRRTRREVLLEMVQLSLDKMAAGGIYDQLGGGFHRYSVDQRWLVPHFEKMLYDNALLAGCYLEAYLAIGRPQYREIVQGTLDYALREMQQPQGGFSSTQDADSEGEEGKFFVWTPQEIAAVLGEEPATTFCRVYDVTERGNFEGRNILNLPAPISVCAESLGRDQERLRGELETSRQKLFEARNRRVHPGLDDKVLVGWNALMIDSLARAGAVLEIPEYLDAARRASEFIDQTLRDPEGRLLHSWRNGQSGPRAFLDDYATLLGAWVTLYECTFDENWIERAGQLAEEMCVYFEDPDNGAFYFAASDHETPITRQKDLVDQATPGGNALAAEGLLRLGRLTADDSLTAAAERTIQAAAGTMRKMPMASGQMLLALSRYLGPACELVLIGGSDAAETAEVLKEIRTSYLPDHVLACRRSGSAADESSLLEKIFSGRSSAGTSPELYVCENFACRRPACDVASAREVIINLAGGEQARGEGSV